MGAEAAAEGGAEAGAEAGAEGAGGGASAAGNIAKVVLQAAAILGGGMATEATYTTAKNAADAAAEAKQSIFRDEETINQISTNNANSAQQAISESETQIDNSTKQNQASASLSSSIFQSMT